MGPRLVGAAPLVAAALLLAAQVQADLPPQRLPSHLAQHLQVIRPGLRPPFDFLASLPHYSVEAELGPDEVTGHLAITVPTSYAGERALYLVLPPRHPEMYPGTSLTLDGLRIDGRPITPASPEDIILEVPIPARAGPPPWELEADFVVGLPSQPAGYGLLYRTEERSVLGGWLPRLAAGPGRPAPASRAAVGDLPTGQPALYDVHLGGVEAAVSSGQDAVSSRGSAASGGRGAGPEPEGATWLAGPAADFAVVAPGRSLTFQSTVDGVMLRYHFLDQPGAATPPEVAFGKLVQAFRVLSDRFGPYPFVELDLVELPVWIGGFEFPGLSLVDARARAIREQGFEFLLVHELSHQWWYAAVGTLASAEPWLDEGLANYAYLLYREALGGPEAAADTLRAWEEEYASRFGGQRLPADLPAADFSDWATYRARVYIGGALFFHRLRQSLGDEAFFSVLRSAQVDYRFRVLPGEEMVRRFEAAAGIELGDRVVP